MLRCEGQSGATRKNLAAVLEEMGARGESMPVVEELVPDFLRCLTRFLQDPTAAVVKRALTSGSTLFRRTFSRAAKKVSLLMLRSSGVHCTKGLGRADGKNRPAASSFSTFASVVKCSENPCAVRFSQYWIPT